MYENRIENLMKKIVWLNNTDAGATLLDYRKRNILQYTSKTVNVL